MVNEVSSVAKNHKILNKDAKHISAGDVEDSELDLIFFDCHDAAAQVTLYYRLRDAGLVTLDTVLAFHDTNLHPTKTVPWDYETAEGLVHQVAERTMVNLFKKLGYDAFSLRTGPSKHNSQFPYRHGVTVMQRFRYLDCRPANQHPPEHSLIRP
jgi:hypothetical protein